MHQAHAHGVHPAGTARPVADAAADVAASPDYVWAVLADVARWPEWTAAVRDAAPVDGGVHVVGGRVRLRWRGVGERVWTVTAHAPRRGFTWMCAGVGVCERVRVSVESADDAGTRTRVAVVVERTGWASGVVRGTAPTHLRAFVDDLARRCSLRRAAHSLRGPRPGIRPACS